MKSFKEQIKQYTYKGKERGIPPKPDTAISATCSICGYIKPLARAKSLDGKKILLLLYCEDCIETPRAKSALHMFAEEWEKEQEVILDDVIQETVEDLLLFDRQKEMLDSLDI